MEIVQNSKDASMVYLSFLAVHQVLSLITYIKDAIGNNMLVFIILHQNQLQQQLRYPQQLLQNFNCQVCLQLYIKKLLFKKKKGLAIDYSIKNLTNNGFDCLWSTPYSEPTLPEGK